ncbi:hypothetical protein [Streptomyces sp. F001]|uniref:hypothetical protein n=1 Tax=Streptomyces sp. F001 TaxID=1510026 RepID=UPI00101E346E|nr:hypothetical protein [Streptomyces sp. F001]
MADDTFLQLLGEITVESSVVEYSAAYYVSYARHRSDKEVAEILIRPGGARTALRKYMQECQKAGDISTEYHARLVEMESRMSAALLERHRLVHAVEVLRMAPGLPDPEKVLWHPKTNINLRVTEDDLRRIISELRHVSGLFIRGRINAAPLRGPESS